MAYTPCRLFSSLFSTSVATALSQLGKRPAPSQQRFVLTLPLTVLQVPRRRARLVLLDGSAAGAAAEQGLHGPRESRRVARRGGGRSRLPRGTYSKKAPAASLCMLHGPLSACGQRAREHLHPLARSSLALNPRSLSHSLAHALTIRHSRALGCHQLPRPAASLHLLTHARGSGRRRRFNSFRRCYRPRTTRTAS